MNDNILWAPWRIGYVQGLGRDEGGLVEPQAWRSGADRGCFLCRAASSSGMNREQGVVERTATSIVMLNRFPYSNGHLLVSPLDHRATLADLSSAERLDLQDRLARWCGVLGRALQAEGFNVGLNLGKVAGAGVPGHLHWHIVPRWSGDVNFMPVTAGTKVLPQSLESLWEQLDAAARLEDA